MIETVITYIVGAFMGLFIIVGALISAGVVLAMVGYGAWLMVTAIWRELTQ